MRAGLDPSSATWRAVTGWAAEEVARHARRLEEPGLDPAKTEECRGRIQQIRDLLRLAEPEPPPVPGSTDTYA